MKRPPLLAGICAGALLFSTQNSFADKDLDFLKGLSLEQLANIEVSITSKRPQRAGDVAAALHVITREDIRRSSATSIPELLRTVPGINVAKIDAHKWAITARGFNGRFANKLLVMIDGRSVYTPLFSGVFWEVQDTLLQDVERIEVIRGPGAAIWGANAVNGVINIITRQSEDTQGTLLYGMAGNEERKSGGGRYGGRLGDNASYRVYAKYSDRDDAVFANGDDGADGMDTQRGGFRVDWQPQADSHFTFLGDIYDGEGGERISLDNLLSPATNFKDTVTNQIDVSGGNLQGRWQHDEGDGHAETVQIIYDYADRHDLIIDYERETFDIEYQRQLPLGDANELMWGLGYRYIRDEFEGNQFVRLVPRRNKEELISGFIQDDISLADDQVVVTLGARIEHNGFSGFEIQPSARARWHVTEESLLWVAVSRAVRTPGRGDHHAKLGFGISPPSPATGGLPVVIFADQPGDFDSETVVAYELGFRTQLNTDISVDIASFYNRYDKLRSTETGATSFSPFPVPHLATLLTTQNKVAGDAFGVEASVDWRAADWWRLRANWSALYMDLHAKGGSTDTIFVRQEDESPEQQFNLISSMNPWSDIDVDMTLRYVDKIEAFGIDDYVAVDARIGWQINKNVHLALVGQNLFDSSHPEYQEVIFDIQETEVERSIYAYIELQF